MKTTRTKIRMLTIGFTLAMLALTLYALLDSERSAFAAVLGQGDPTRPATVDPGPGTVFISPELWGILQKQSIGGEVPETVHVDVDTLTNVKVKPSLAKHINEVGGKRVKKTNAWKIPTDRALEIVQRADVYYVALVQDRVPAPNPRLNEPLNNVMTAIANGIPAVDAVQYAFPARDNQLVVEVITPDVNMATAVQGWLKEKMVYIPEYQRTEKSNDRIFGLLISAEVLSELLENHSTVKARSMSAVGDLLPLTRSRWPDDSLAFEKGVVDTFLPPPPKFYSAVTPTAKEQKYFDASETLAKKRHNVQSWHDEGYEGEGITVGIIDWGYRDFHRLPDIPSLTKTSDEDEMSTTYNAYCQSVYESILPNSGFFRGKTSPCEPVAGFEAYKMRHGNNIAELVKRMAPKATLLMAQANSPRQVYNAADWLKDRGADVIVHAGGWQYDGPGDGTSPLDVDLYDDNTWLGTDPHHPARYYPSPLVTVDEITKDKGPVWVNAAGNHEKWSLWVDEPGIITNIDTDDKFYGAIVLDPRKSVSKNNRKRTCQYIPMKSGEIIYYAMRWADTWPAGEMKLDYELIQVFPWTQARITGHQDSSDHTQYPTNHPVRRTSKQPISPLNLCLRIYSRSIDGAVPEAPDWIQFQALVAKQAVEEGPTWRDDEPGRSIVNPSESANKALLAVGAASLRKSPIKVTDFSSRGFIFDDDDVITDDTSHLIKPDVVASTDAATLTKWLWDCRAKGQHAQHCGDDLYFTGTSGATAHTGGIAALVAEYLEDVAGPSGYGPEDVANFLRGTAKDLNDTGSGHGFVELPCFSVPKRTATFTVSSQSWSKSDCDSERQSGAKSDFYTFNLTQTQNVLIGVSSLNKNPYIYLVAGPHAEGVKIAEDTSEIETLLEAGMYTIEVTTEGRNSNKSGTYTLEVSNSDPSTYLYSDPSTVGLTVGGSTRSFRLYSSGTIKVIANPTERDEVLQMTTYDPTTSSCFASQNRTSYLVNWQYVYLKGCAAGEGVLELRDQSTGNLLNIYRIKVTE